MKILTEKGLQQIEEHLKCSSLSSLTSKLLRLEFPSFKDALDGKRELTNMGISFREDINNILEVKLSSIVDKFDNEDVRCWCPPNSQTFFLCSEMEHSHLSNCIHFYEILFSLGRLTENDSQNYLQSLEENIVPELSQRFNSEILPYTPKFDWELKLYEEFKSLANS